MGEDIRLKSAAGEIGAYLATPKGTPRGGIVVIASHHVARVLRLCNRAVILHQGRVTFDETKRQPWPSFDQAFGEFLPRGDP